MKSSNIRQPLFEMRSIESLCLRVTSGGTPSRKNPSFFQHGVIRWIKTKELKDWYIDDSEEKITIEALNNSSAKLFPANTVLMAMYGDGITITSLGVLRKECATNQACCAMIVDPKVCKYLFLFYSLKFHRNDFIHLASGASQRNLNTQTIKNFQIKIPSLHVQDKIINILSAYDRLIENNTIRIKILEEMTQMLYREWFVNFRFPNHENVKMVESDLGLIPEGWEVVELGKLIDVKHGYAFKGEYFSKEPTYDILLTPTNFAIGGGFKDDKFKYYSGEVPNDYILKANDLLVTMTDLSKLGDTLGYPALIPDSKAHRFLHNQRLGKIIIRNTKLIGKNLLYYIFRSDVYRHHVLASATGSTVKHTAPDRIKSFKMILPSTSIRQKFEDITDLQLNQIEILKRKNLVQDKKLQK